MKHCAKEMNLFCVDRQFYLKKTYEINIYCKI